MAPTGLTVRLRANAPTIGARTTKMPREPGQEPIFHETRGTLTMPSNRGKLRTFGVELTADEALFGTARYHLGCSRPGRR